MCLKGNYFFFFIKLNYNKDSTQKIISLHLVTVFK
jgi:hypothetical protein